MSWEEEDGGQSSADCLEHPMIPEKLPDQGTSPQGSPDTEDMARSQCCNCRAGQHCSDSVPRTLAGPHTKKNQLNLKGLEKYYKGHKQFGSRQL